MALKNLTAISQSFSVGEGDLNLAEGAALVLLSKVTQGGKPVVGALVTAIVDRWGDY